MITYQINHICFKCVQRQFWPKTFLHFCWNLTQLSVWHFPILDWVWNSVQREEEEMSGSKWAVKRKVAHRTQKWTQLNCCCNILQLGHCAMCCIGWHWSWSVTETFEACISIFHPFDPHPQPPSLLQSTFRLIRYRFKVGSCTCSKLAMQNVDRH